MDNIKNIYKETIDTWGLDNQVDMMIEEM